MEPHSFSPPWMPPDSSLKSNENIKFKDVESIDAFHAGTAKALESTLIVIEGDASVEHVRRSMPVHKRDYFGVVSIKGKFANARGSRGKIDDNPAIQCILQMMGLERGKIYETAQGLRYGHLMIMTDQDVDGWHIKCLLINFLQFFWPSLLKMDSFVRIFVTPIIKVKRNRYPCTSIIFYSSSEHESWKEKEKIEIEGKLWGTKYYKGLSSSTLSELKECFENMDQHVKDLSWSDNDDTLIDVAFSKSKSDERKTFAQSKLKDLQKSPDTFLDYRVTQLRFSDIFHKELVMYWVTNVRRCIPSMMDGFKPLERKILFCCFKYPDEENTVESFSGVVTKDSSYRHASKNAGLTIIGMAQDFVGSNNLNLLEPGGSFGSRYKGGSDHASPRYISIKLSPITKYLFRENDDVLLDYLNEGEKKVEPVWYAPVIPLVLVNGVKGVGTGFSTFIPKYNPRDIIKNLRKLLNGDNNLEPMVPWYRGFKGTFVQVTGGYHSVGLIDKVNETTVRITELPIGKWTASYTGFLDKLKRGERPFIQRYVDNSSDKTVCIDITMSKEDLLSASNDYLIRKFKLTKSIRTSNMHLFDSKGELKKYNSPEEIVKDFYAVRYELYNKRKGILMQKLQNNYMDSYNKAVCIKGVLTRINYHYCCENCKFLSFWKEDPSLYQNPRKRIVNDDVVVGNIVNTETEESFQASLDGDYLKTMKEGDFHNAYMTSNHLRKKIEQLSAASPRFLWELDLQAVELLYNY